MAVREERRVRSPRHRPRRACLAPLTGRRPWPPGADVSPPNLEIAVARSARPQCEELDRFNDRLVYYGGRCLGAQREPAVSARFQNQAAGG
jgi:hypothetical protein